MGLTLRLRLKPWTYIKSKVAFVQPDLIYSYYNLMMRLYVIGYALTFRNEREDAAEPRVVRLYSVSVQLENKVARRRIVLLRDHAETSAQLVVPDSLLVDFRSLDVQVEPQVVDAPGGSYNQYRYVKLKV